MWTLAKQSKHSSLCAFLRALMLRISFLLLDGVSPISVEMVENKYFLCSPNTHMCTQALHCRWVKFSSCSLQLTWPHCWSLLLHLLALPRPFSYFHVTLLLFCDFKACFPGIPCWLTVSINADNFHCSWAYTMQSYPRVDWTCQRAMIPLDK